MRRVLHPKKEILASCDCPHPGFVDNLEIRVSIEHFNHVIVARHQRRAGIWIGGDELLREDRRIGQEGAKQPEAEPLGQRLLERGRGLLLEARALS
jgi:hypothetical protein